MMANNVRSSGSTRGVLNMVTKYRNNADDILRVAVIADGRQEEQLRTVVTALCPFLYNDDDEYEEQQHLHHQQQHQQGDLIVRPLNGGLSNELFTVSAPSLSSSPTVSGGKNKTVLVRIHPSSSISSSVKTQERGTSKSSSSTSSSSKKGSGCGVSVVDREIENRLAAWLSEQGQAPTYFGRFENGRVEEFYDHVVPLSFKEMPEYGTQIASALAKFHQLQAPISILPKPSTEKFDATIYETIDSWLSSFSLLFDNINFDEEKKEESNIIIEDTIITDNDDDIRFIQMLQSEWDWLLHQLQQGRQNDNNATSSSSTIQQEAINFIREVVVTHMDCQSLNILKQDSSEGENLSSNNNNNNNNTTSSDNIRLIDFEYAGWNPRAADIANTFCEHCDMNNICADYHKEYPSENIQNTFFMSYLQEANPMLLERLNDEELQIYLKTLREEVGRFTLLSHLGWSIWSVLKSKEISNNIDFDYMLYARHRMDGYNIFKKKFFFV